MSRGDTPPEIASPSPSPSPSPPPLPATSLVMLQGKQEGGWKSLFVVRAGWLRTRTGPLLPSLSSVRIVPVERLPDGSFRPIGEPRLVR